MAIISRREVIKELIDGCRLDPAIGAIPLELSDKIMPTFETKPSGIVNRIASATDQDTGTTTVLTTAANKRSFLIGFDLSLDRTSLCTSQGATVNCRLVGRSASQVVGGIAFNDTAGVQSGQITRDFSRPVELEPATTISVTQTFGAGDQDMRCSVTLYEVED